MYWTYLLYCHRAETVIEPSSSPGRHCRPKGFNQDPAIQWVCTCSLFSPHFLLNLFCSYCVIIYNFLKTIFWLGILLAFLQGDSIITFFSFCHLFSVADPGTDELFAGISSCSIRILWFHRGPRQFNFDPQRCSYLCVDCWLSCEFCAVPACFLILFAEIGTRQF